MKKKKTPERSKIYMYTSEKNSGSRITDCKKHSEVRPQGGHVYNYKALQRVGG